MGKFERSYVHGASVAPLFGETIGAFFDKAAVRWADRDALISRHQGIRWTYAELHRRAENLASGLLALGLRPGDRIGIWSPTCAEWTLTQFATAKAGLILVNINPAYRPAELVYALNLVGCRALVLADAFKSSDFAGMLREAAPEIGEGDGRAIAAAGLPTLEMAILIAPDHRPGFLRFDDVATGGTAASRAELAAIGPNLQFDDPINIQFTSGTTGNPKGATLSHHNILNNAFLTGERLKMTEADRVCIPLPLYHCFGMVTGNLGCVTHGAAMVYPGAVFDPLLVLQALEAERCTTLYGVPTMFIAELNHPDFAKFDLSSLRTGIMGGSPCPIEVMKRVASEMHMPEVAVAYGMTETSPVSFQTSLDDPLERRVSTVGTVHPHAEVKIVDLDGRVVPPGTPGELCVRGYLVMRGYWGDPERTKEAIDAEGWMHTGDLATLDEAGYCNIVGRLKDMAIRGGENIYPREVEEFLYQHPKIAEVQVAGVPDAVYGEEICAWVRLKSGEDCCEDDLRAFCKGRIAHYKAPRYIRFVDAFPLTATGKVQKFVLREMLIKELGLTSQTTA